MLALSILTDTVCLSRCFVLFAIAIAHEEDDDDGDGEECGGRMVSMGMGMGMGWALGLPEREYKETTKLKKGAT